MTERIEGVPVGTKLVAIRRPVCGEYVLNVSNMRPERVYVVGQFAGGGYPIIAPDNVYGVVDLATFPIPDGYERDGDKPEDWFRDLNSTDSCWYLSSGGGKAYLHQKGESCTDDCRRIILRKLKPKTKRVLVVECEQPWHNGEPAALTVIYHNENMRVISHRIEERPL